MADSILTRASNAIFKRSPTETIGTSRETADTGYAGELAGSFDAPDRELNLTGTRKWDEYDRIVRDIAVVGAGTRLFLNLISNAVWTVNPPEGLNEQEEARAQEYADFAYNQLFSMTTSWSAIVRKTAAYKLNGFCVQEWTARRTDDGMIGLKDIEHRPQRTITRWKRDEGGTVEAVIQRVPSRPDVELPRGKIIYAVDDTLTDSPEGIGLFRHMAKTAYRLDTFLNLEEIGFTTDLRGVPIARVPMGEIRKKVAATPEGSEARAKMEAWKTAVLQPMRNFLTKHIRSESTGLMTSSETYNSVSPDKTTTPSSVPKWGLEILNGNSQSFPDMANAINRMNQELARILGVEHLLLGADGAGSLALAKSKIGTFYLTVTSTLLDLLEIYDRDLIAPLAELNGWEPELIPEMGVNEISDRDIEQVAEILAKLAQAGAPVLPDDPAIGEIYDLLGLTRPPERVDDAELSLTPDRGTLPPEPANDDIPNTEAIAKVRILRSKRNQAKAMMKRRANAKW